MTLLRFETRDRGRALGFLRRFYPNHDVRDEADCAGPLLDLVQADVIRIPDPQFHPGGAVMPSKNWTEDRRAEVMQAFATFERGLSPTPTPEAR